jgi:L-amino acid N-acyltransferase YncA
MIREVEPRDIPQITRIYNGYVTGSTATFETLPVSDDEMRERVESIRSSFPYYVYEQEGEVAGYCYAHRWKARAAYSKTLETTVYISPQHQREGIGRALMRKLIAQCKQEGYMALIACITGGNDASIALHENLGFKKVSHFEKVGLKFGRLLDVTDYELRL